MRACVVRTLTGQDALAFRRLRLEGLGEAPSAFHDTLAEATERTIEEWQADLDEPDAFTLGALTPERELCGTVGCRRPRRARERHKATLGGLYVAPGRRRQGVGGSLVAAAIDLARLWPGVEQVNLVLVSGNDDARALYVDRGFGLWGLERRGGLYQGHYVDLEFMGLRLDA